MDKRIEKIIVSNEEIVETSKRLAGEIDAKFADKKPPILLGVLKGCVPFMAELMKHLTIDVEVEFMAVSSYHGGTKSSGLVKIVLDINEDVSGRDVIIAEDIIDTGRSLKKLKELLEFKGANVTIVTLLDKPSGRVVDIKADHTGVVIPNEFVVGFGLDYEGLLRNLPYIGVLKKEVYGG
jgi:hypoxanthine phosphoribosyltransferase